MIFFLNVFHSFTLKIKHSLENSIVGLIFGRVNVGGTILLRSMYYFRSIFQRSNYYRRSKCHTFGMFGAYFSETIVGGAINTGAKCRRSKYRRSNCRRSICRRSNCRRSKSSVTIRTGEVMYGVRKRDSEINAFKDVTFFNH